jgi:mannose-6-phosphate isomerase-like protein (cupin superfamily)
VSAIPEQAIEARPYALAREAGVTDVWWPPGGRYTIKTAAEQTGGRLLQMLCTDSRGAAPPLHIHREVDETFYVIAGELTIFVGDERIEARPGDFVLGPRGVPHSFVVRSERAEFLATYAPAGTAGPAGCGVEGLFCELAAPVTPGERPPDSAAPSLEEFARKAAIYGIKVVGPPPTFD